MVNIEFLKPGRVVKDEALIEIYYQHPIPVYNIIYLDNSVDPTSSSGTLSIATYPIGIDLYNRDVGIVGDLDLQTSGINPLSRVFDITLKRSGISISGARVVGRV